MAQPIAEAVVLVRPDTSNFTKEVKDKLKPAIKEAEQQAQTLGNRVGAAFSAAGTEVEKFRSQTRLAALATVGVMGLVGRSVVGQASDLNESVNAINVTFGRAADEILKLGENAAQAVGLSNSEFNALAVRFSAFAKTIAGPGGDVVGVVNEMTTRVADFASVMNLDVPEAAQIFQSALAGETEPIRRFGKDVSEATVKQFAYANGIAETGKELTEQQKVLARYGALMAQTADTQGDFANTSGEFANATRIATAEFKNAGAAIGTALLPLLGGLTNGLRVVGQFASENSRFVLAMGAAIATAAVGVISLNVAMGIYNTIATATKVINTLLATSFTTLQVAMGAIGLVLTAATAAYFLLRDSKDEATEATRRFADALYEEGDAQKEAIAQLAMSNPTIAQTFELMTALGYSVDDLQQYLTTGEGPLEDFQVLLYAAATQGDNASGAVALLGDKLVGLIGTMGLTGAELQAMNAAFGALIQDSNVYRQQLATLTGLGLNPANAAIKRVGSGASKTRQEIKRLRDELKDDFSNALDKARGKLDDARQRFADFAKGVRESLLTALNAQTAYDIGQETGTGFLNGLQQQVDKVRTFGELTNRLLTMGISEQGLQQVLSAGVDAGTAIAQELINGGAEAITGPNGINALVASAETAAQAVGNNAAQSFRQAGIDTATALVRGIDSVIRNYRLQLKSTSLTTRQLQELQRNFDVAVNLRFTSAGLPELANGAIVSRPTTALIGEAGAEAVIPMSRPARALQLMEAAGLADLVRGQRSAAVNIERATFVTPTDADLVAQKVVAAERARSFGR